MSARFVFLSLFVFGASFAPAASPALPDIKGIVIKVVDGDSITVLTEDKTQIKIRLEGIDAPATDGQPFAQRSRQELNEMVFKKQVVVKNHGLDMYKRTLGRVFCDGTDVCLEMVRRGMAWRFDKYSQEQALLDAQNEAKAAGRGLWADKDPVPPWVWRKEKKARKSSS
jgi:endonuclease YncB( thermonuclease family)